MKMKKIIAGLLTISSLLFAKQMMAQKVQQPFKGAKAVLQHYNALYYLNSDNEKTITGTLRNIKNALEDPRLKNKLTVEIVAFGDGVAVFQKQGIYEEKVKNLQAMGVILAQCENTIRERHIDKENLFPFISYVPSGNGEIIIRQYQGWAIVHP